MVIQPDDKVVVHCALRNGSRDVDRSRTDGGRKLECDWSKVVTEYPTPGQSLARQRVWGDFSTGGSRGIRMSHEYVRKGGAAARIVLLQAAANAWSVPASECTVLKGIITHSQTERTTTYGKVALAAAKLEVPKDVPLKNAKDWKLVGKRLARLDTADKTTGKQIYGMDLTLPGMLNAAVKECPCLEARSRAWMMPPYSSVPA